MTLEERYNKYYKELILHNNDLLIETFILYYGEKYRNIIMDKINSLNYCWIKNDRLINLYKIYNKSKDIKYFLNYPKNTIIGSTLNNKDLFSCIKKVLDTRNNGLSFFLTIPELEDSELIPLIVFPIFLHNDKMILHEINHAIVSNPLIKLENNIVYKSGLEVMGKYNLIDEIINERSALDITNIFHDLGGNILEKKYKLQIDNDYEKMFPIIEKFYTKYLEVIKNARISLNLNILYKYIDENIFNKYVEFVNSVFDIYKQSINNKKFYMLNEYIYFAEKLVDDMDKSNKRTLN